MSRLWHSTDGRTRLDWLFLQSILKLNNMKSVIIPIQRQPRSSLGKALLTVLLGVLTLIFMVHFLLSGGGLFTAHSSSSHVLDTWREYRSYFIRSQTSIAEPEYLAALTQVELENKNSNPLVRRASLAPMTEKRVGLTGLSKNIFERASHLCVNGQKVQKVNGLSKWDGCWARNFELNSSDARSIEITSASLTVLTNTLLKKFNLRGLERHKVENITTMIHFCGMNEATRFIRNGLRAPKNLVCSGQNMGFLVRKVKSYRQAFTRAKLKERA